MALRAVQAPKYRGQNPWYFGGPGPPKYHGQKNPGTLEGPDPPKYHRKDPWHFGGDTHGRTLEVALRRSMAVILMPSSHPPRGPTTRTVGAHGARNLNCGPTCFQKSYFGVHRVSKTRIAEAPVGSEIATLGPRGPRNRILGFTWAKNSDYERPRGSRNRSSGPT